VIRDAALLAELAAGFARRDPLPGEVLRAARQAWTPSSRRGSDRQLAVVRDTALGVGPMSVRGAGYGRHTLDFAGSGVLLTVEVSREADGVRLSGLLDSAHLGTVVVHWPDGAQTLAVDGIGGFGGTGLPCGPLSLAVHRPGEPVARTPWFLG
jgi:hypothetical protein